MLPTPHQEQPIYTPNAASGLISSVAVPGHIIAQGKRAVGITANGLTDVLKTFYEAGVRRTQIVIDVAGQRLTADAAIYRKIDKRSGRTSYWLYPLGTAQTLLRELFHKHRAGAAPNAKRPLPIAILAIIPRLK